MDRRTRTTAYASGLGARRRAAGAPASSWVHKPFGSWSAMLLARGVQRDIRDRRLILVLAFGSVASPRKLLYNPATP